MEATGELQEMLYEAQETTQNEMDDLTQKLIRQITPRNKPIRTAWEMVRERYLLLPPENLPSLTPVRDAETGPQSENYRITDARQELASALSGKNAATISRRSNCSNASKQRHDPPRTKKSALSSDMLAGADCPRSLIP